MPLRAVIPTKIRTKETIVEYEAKYKVKNRKSVDTVSETPQMMGSARGNIRLNFVLRKTPARMPNTPAIIDSTPNMNVPLPGAILYSSGDMFVAKILSSRSLTPHQVIAPAENSTQVHPKIHST